MLLILGRRQPLALALGLTLVLAACATHEGLGANPDGTVEPYGFFSGIWHGMVFPLTVVIDIALIPVKGILLFVALVWKSQSEYAFFLIEFLGIDLIGEPNTGFFYFVGYLIGLSEWGGGGSYAVGQRQ